MVVVCLGCDIRSIIRMYLNFYNMSLFSEYSVNNSRAAKRGGKNSTGGTGMTEALEVLTRRMIYKGQDTG